MKKLTFDIVDSKHKRVSDAVENLFPCPIIENPEWTGEKDKVNKQNIRKYTKEQWVKQHYEDMMIRDLARYEQKERIKDSFQPEKSLEK